MKAPWDTLFQLKENIWREPDPFVTAFLRELKPGLRVLDLGCGCGRHVVEAARLGMEVVGTDESKVALLYAEEWLQLEGLKADLVSARFDALPFPADRFDAIVAVYCLNHGTSNDIRMYFSEIDRVLARQGRICIILNASGDYREGLGEKLEEHTYILPDGPEAGIPHHFSTRDFVNSLLAFAKCQEVTPYEKSLAELEKMYGQKMQLHDHPAVRMHTTPRVSHWLISAQK